MTDQPDRNVSSLGIADTEDRAAVRHHTADEAALRQFTIDAARLLGDSHCEQVLVLDVQGLSDITDYILIASGTSDRQIKSVGQEVADLAAEAGLSKFGQDVDDPTNWLVIDFVDVIVHLFDPATRAHYDLEMMWGDAPRVAWQRQAE